METPKVKRALGNCNCRWDNHIKINWTGIGFIRLEIGTRVWLLWTGHWVHRTRRNLLSSPAGVQASEAPLCLPQSLCGPGPGPGLHPPALLPRGHLVPPALVGTPEGCASLRRTRAESEKEIKKDDVLWVLQWPVTVLTCRWNETIKSFVLSFQTFRTRFSSHVWELPKHL